MKLYYMSASPFVRKVTVTAIEKGLDAAIERIPTAVHPVNYNEDFGARNPVAKIPALELDDGTVLHDSRVICDYLDETGVGPRLRPVSGPERWRILKTESLADAICDSAILIRYEQGWRPEDLRWDDWIAAQYRKMDAGLIELDHSATHLGRAFDAAAIAVACLLGYLDFRFETYDWRAKAPNLGAWYEQISGRPSLVSTVPYV